MKRKRFRPKKRLGQNFLYDPAIAEKIAAAARIEAGDTVVELGGGRGILTRSLAAREIRLITIELDAPLVEALVGEFVDSPGEAVKAHVEVVGADFTTVSLRELLAARKLGHCTLVGNIPYYLTRDVLFDFLIGEHEVIDGAIIMVQKEVGERIVSPPGSRVYGITSVILQSLYTVKVVTKVAPGSFHPRPRVASVVLEFRPLQQAVVAPHELASFVALVRNLFQQRRKTIHKTLRSVYSLSDEVLEGVHAATGIDLQSRPEALDNESFIALVRALAEVTDE